MMEILAGYLLEQIPLVRLQQSILDSIPCPEIQKWAEDLFKDMLANGSDEYRKVSNKLAVQKHREKKKELKLRVIDGDQQ